MPPRRIHDRLQDVLDAISKARNYYRDDPNLADDQVLEAVLYNLAVVGEAIKDLPLEVKALAPEADWSPAAKLRDFVIHKYFAVDRLVIASTIEKDLPGLKAAVTKLLAEMS